jgi:hypothetical protein
MLYFQRSSTLTHQVIFGHDFESPRAAADYSWQEDPAEDKLPKLKRASDMLTAIWLRGHPNPKNLRYYLAYQVQNDETTPVIAKILRDANLDQVPYWPGFTVGMWTEEGVALLGKQRLPTKTCGLLHEHLRLVRLETPNARGEFQEHLKDEHREITNGRDVLQA